MKDQVVVADPIRSYLEVKRVLQAATGRVEKMVRTIEEAAAKLRAWDLLCMTNCGVEFPPEQTNGRKFDAKDWPTAPELAKALVAWHEARRAAEKAWQQIPQDDRVGLQLPI